MDLQGAEENFKKATTINPSHINSLGNYGLFNLKYANLSIYLHRYKKRVGLHDDNHIYNIYNRTKNDLMKADDYLGRAAQLGT